MQVSDIVCDCNECSDEEKFAETTNVNLKPGVVDFIAYFKGTTVTKCQHGRLFALSSSFASPST